jgi:DNA-binding PucR family transcriptional regulator
VLRVASDLAHRPVAVAADRMSDASAEVQHGDLFALAEAFADMVGGPVIVEDANFRVLSYSSFTGSMDQGRNTAILGRRMPPEWLSFLEASGDLERLRTGADVVDLASGPWQAHRRLITAVRTPTQMLGVIWAAEGERPLPEHAARSLRRAADLAVPHLARHQEGYRAERMWRGQLVRSLLDGRGQLHRHADELGLPRNRPLAVLAFAPRSDEALSDEVWDRITDHVALSCEAFRWHAAVARVGRAVFAVLARTDEQPEDGPVRLGRDIVNRSVPVLRGTLCGAASSSGTRLGRIPRQRIEAEDALGIARAGDTRFVSYEDVLPAVILREIRETLAQREELRLPGIQALLDEDARRDTELVVTLRTYLRCASQASSAARELGIHVTTLRYRLGRVREVSGLDIDDPTVRVVCELLLAPAVTGLG